MSAVEESLNSPPKVKRKSAPILNRFLDFISSVRFGVVQLCILVVLAMTGMLILQQNVDGFDAYYASLTPAERIVFGYLGLFDIYHSWYFNLMLLVLSLNIILASIDRFPSAWSYISRPKVKGTRGWLLARKDNAILDMSGTSVDEATAKIKAEFESQGYRTVVTDEPNARYIFGQRGQYNRLGAYIVHVALLTLFLGHFVALQTGFDADVRMMPGEKMDEIQKIVFDLDQKKRYSVKLPFTLECTDIQQRLINEDGNIDVTNTLDWRTEVKINDPAYGETVAEVSLNRPYTYRGFRFFQAQTIPVGNARTVTLDLTPQGGGTPSQITIPRLGSTQLPDGTKVEYTDFEPDFTFGQNGQPDTKSGEYNNPTAILNVTPPGGEATRVFAFAQKLPDNAPVGAPKAGYKWHLASFEKSPLAHILSIKYDPYNAAFVAWYIGGFGLVLALIFVFFISHRRVWAEIPTSVDGTSDIVIAGGANRNQLAFGDKFKKLVEDLSAK